MCFVYFRNGISCRPLINIWMPSAFLRGTTSDAYHVYQVFVRVRDEEWNIYRRYAEFYELHIKLKKRYPVANTFDFPPKKAIGNKVCGNIYGQKLYHVILFFTNHLIKCRLVCNVFPCFKVNVALLNVVGTKC